MPWFLFVSIYYVVPSYSTVAVSGQCMVSSCAFSAMGSEESALDSFAEHHQSLEKLKICSVCEKLEATINRTLMNGSVVDALREHDQKLRMMNEQISLAIDKFNEKLNILLRQVNWKDPVHGVSRLNSRGYCRNASVVCDCSDIANVANGNTTSGVYRIYVVDQGVVHYANAYCDMSTTNGGWTVFQRRQDGSVDFEGGWNDYENGFGNPNGEFWLGNKFIHLLTSKRRYRLRIDMEDFEGGKRYAEYSTFNISSSADKYRLRIGNYSGPAGGDSLSQHNGHRFSTKDNDNDVARYSNCAVHRHGPWWYTDGYCGRSSLNGFYLRGRYSTLDGSYSDARGIYWEYWHRDGPWYSLKTTEMKIYFY